MFEKFLQSARPNLQKVFFEPALGKEQQGTGKEELTDFIFKRIERYERNRRINEK